jgi:DNA helicase HerA-like ATPase
MPETKPRYTVHQKHLAIGQTTEGKTFTLPTDAATQKMALMGKSGSGKTYAATKLAESLYGIGVQIVALDPVGVWYGLRLDKSGKADGLPIPVFGGEYGDIPLEPGAGALVAETIVNRNISVILDVSSFRKAQRREFVTAFAEELFHRKKAARSPIMLFMEECQFFIPQKVFKGEERLLGAFEDIGKVGRNYGIGLTMISQRPQAVNKEVLNQAEALFALQMMAAQERKAVRDWIDAQGIDAGAVVDDLPHLKIGEAYLWSPMWLRFFGKIKFGE